MNTVSVTLGDSPVVLAMPHTGSFLPESVKTSLNETGLQLSDTDWHIDTLYADLLPDATIVKANFHRYLIDANRDPSGESLYPGQNTTGLCPLTDFDGLHIYKPGKEPSKSEIEQRRVRYHSVYHLALQQQLHRIKSKHGVAVLYDCHSIRSEIPYLFENTLPDLNIGTFEGKSCDKRLSDIVEEACRQSDHHNQVLNGRFKGGWTTRHYGRPQEHLHAIQMEISQKNYMRESPPWQYEKKTAEKLRAVLGPLLQQLAQTALTLK